MKYIIYLLIFTLSSCKKEELVLPQIKHKQVDSLVVKKSKSEKKIKIKKKRNFKK
jgi:hypothetical protein